jgi:hypothetical protein
MHLTWMLKKMEGSPRDMLKKKGKHIDLDTQRKEPKAKTRPVTLRITFCGN